METLYSMGEVIEGKLDDIRMICPNCKKDARFATTQTRHRFWGVKRTRVCPFCDYHLATIEIYQVTQAALDSLKQGQILSDAKVNERKAL